MSNKMCIMCGNNDVYHATIPYTRKIHLKNGRIIYVVVDYLMVEKCLSCNEIYFSDRADRQIEDVMLSQMTETERMEYFLDQVSYALGDFDDLGNWLPCNWHQMVERIMELRNDA